MRGPTILLALLFAGCAATGGSGTEATESRDYLTDFDGVHTRDGIRAVVEVGALPTVTIRADSNYLDQEDHDDVLATALLGDALDIFARGGIDPLVEPIVTIGVDALAFLSTEGERTTASASSVAAGRFGAAASGGSLVEVSGTCAELVVVASGASTVDVEMLDCVDARIDAQGDSVVRATVTGRLDVRASGGSSIEISGSPREVSQTLSDGAVLDIL